MEKKDDNSEKMECTKASSTVEEGDLMDLDPAESAESSSSDMIKEIEKESEDESEEKSVSDSFESSEE